MKKYTTTIAIIVILVLVFFFAKKTNPQIAIYREESVLGCYVATLGKDVYDLKVNSQNGENVTGVLTFNNFEKDSSYGPFVGTYRDGILLGTYTFESEGTTSVMQVIFKKMDKDFIRGYGDMSTTTNEFTDISKVSYDTSAVFKSSPCVENQ